MCWGCSLHLAACPATLPWALGGIREVPRWPLPGGSRKRVQKGTLTSHLLSVMGLMLKSLTRPRSWYMCSRQLSICGDESRAWLPPTGPRPPPSREKCTGPARQLLQARAHASPPPPRGPRKHSLVTPNKEVGLRKCSRGSEADGALRQGARGLLQGSSVYFRTRDTAAVGQRQCEARGRGSPSRRPGGGLRAERPFLSLPEPGDSGL